MKKVLPLFLIIILVGCKPKDGGTTTGNPNVSLSVSGSSKASTVAVLKKEVHHFLKHFYSY